MNAIQVSKKEFNRIKSQLKNNENNTIKKDSKTEGYMKNKLTDLNNHLFEQLERLNDDDLTDEQLKKEIDRSKAMSNIATNIISNGNLMLDAMKFMDETGCGNTQLQPEKLLGLSKDEI